MFTTYEFEAINSKYAQLVKERKTKITKIWVIVFVSIILIDAAILYFTDWLEGESGSILVPVYGGLALIGAIIGIVISAYGISLKPIFNYLYKEIYDKISIESQKKISYTPFEKLDNYFVGQGGLFSRHSRAQVYRHTQSKYEDITYDIIDCMLITGSGKNQTVHLNGIYFYFKKHTSSLLQIRSNGSPKLKGYKFTKIDSSDIFKVYVEEDKSLSGADRAFIYNMSELKNKLHAKKIYLSITRDEVHFAYVPNKQWRRIHTLSLNSLNELYKKLLDEEEVIKDLLNSAELYNEY